MSSHTNVEQLSNYYNYLDTILPILTEIYKCPCKTCIDVNTEKILEIVPNVKEFYYFIIECNKFIHQNENYLKKIKELIPNMILFNNVAIKDTICTNIETWASVIYSENENYTTELQTINTRKSIFTLEQLYQYYPEMREEFKLC